MKYKTIRLVVTLLAVLYSGTQALAVTVNITNNTLWSVINSGSGPGGQPSALDFIIVKNDKTLTIDVSNAVCLKMEVGAAGSNNGFGILTFNSGAVLTIITDLILGKNSPKDGSLEMTFGGTLKIGGSFTAPDLDHFYPGLGTIEYTGSSSQVILKTSELVNSYNNLSISGGNTKTLADSVKVTGLVTIPAGNILASSGLLTLQANATSNANIGPLLSGADVIGDVRIQSFLTGGSKAYRGTRVMSSPINDAAIITGKRTYEQLKDFMFVTGPGGVTKGFDEGGLGQPFAPTLLLYNEPGPANTYSFIEVNNIYVNSTPGIGFFVFFRGNRSSPFTPTGKTNAPYDLPENVTVTYDGPINKFDITRNLSYTNNINDLSNGYNSLGNPYPCTIDWELVTKSANVLNALYIPKAGGGTGTYLNGVSNNGGSRYIQSGKGFYVVATASGAFVTFTEGSKNVSNGPARLLSAPTEDRIMSSKPLFKTLDRSTASLKLMRISIQDSLNTEETTVVFETGKTINNTGEDVVYLTGSAVSLASMTSDNKIAAINFIQDISEVKELKLFVNATSSGTFKLNFSDLSGTQNYQVMLKDALFPDQLFDIKANSVYSFNIDKSDAATYGTNRFILLIKPEANNNVASPHVSFEKANLNQGIIVYPNPASDQITVNMPHYIHNTIEIIVFDMQGKKVKNSIINHQSHINQNINDLDHGVYVLELRNAENNEVLGRTKFIK